MRKLSDSMVASKRILSLFNYSKIIVLFKKNWIFFFIFLVGIFFLFKNLDDIYLFRDEATVALVSKNILKVGYPLAHDDKNIFYEFPTDVNSKGVWIHYPWLQMYLIVLSFFLFGANTFTDRLPFAFIGVLSIFLLYVLVQKLFKDRIMTLFVLVIYITSVPLLLFLRRGLYPPLVIFLSLAVLYSYVNVLHQRRYGTFWLTVSFILLFHSMYHVYFIYVTSLLLYSAFYFLFKRKSFLLKDTFLSVIFSLIFIVPWIIYAETWTRQRYISPDSIFTNLWTYLLYINQYIFPITLVILTLFVMVLFSKQFFF